MLEGIYAWTCSIAGYFLFVTVLEQLLPGKKYGKYVRLFSGMVLILLVVQPLTDREAVEAQITRDYETLLFQYEAGDLKEEILGIEHQRLEQIIRQYEEAVEGDIRMMAEDGGVDVRDCQVTICADQEKEAFGTVSSVKLAVYEGGESRETQQKEGETAPEKAGEPAQEAAGKLAKENAETLQEEAGESVKKAGEAENAARINPVKMVTVDLAGQGTVEPENEGNPASFSWLRKKIADYYSLEEAYVEIQVVEGEG